LFLIIHICSLAMTLTLMSRFVPRLKWSSICTNISTRDRTARALSFITQSMR
jgi:hypothetical protein